MKIPGLLFLASVAQAIPVAVFENQNGGGQYKQFDTPSATCRNFLGADAFWNDRISYVQIPPNVKCQFYVDINCTGAAWVVVAGAGGWLGNVPNEYNDRITAMACFSL